MPGSVRELVDLRDGARVRVDRETDLVAWLDTLKERERLDVVPHRHRLHESLDLAMLQDHLLLLRPHGDHGAFSGHELGLGPQCLVLAGYVWTAVTGQRVRIVDHGPPVAHRQLSLPRGHHGAFRLERFDEPSLADAPEPEISRHLRHHRGVSEIRWLELEANRGRSLTISSLAVTERALRSVDLVALGDHRGISPGFERNLGVRIRGRDGRMLVIPASLARSMSVRAGLRKSRRLLGLDMMERDSAHPGGNQRAHHECGEQRFSTNHTRLLRRGRRAPWRLVPDGLQA